MVGWLFVCSVALFIGLLGLQRFQKGDSIPLTLSFVLLTVSAFFGYLLFLTKITGNE